MAVWGHKIHFSVVWSLSFSCLNPPFCLDPRVWGFNGDHFAYCIICYHTLHHMLGDDSLWIPSILLLRTPGYCSSWGHICSCRSEVRFLQGEAPFGQENIENQQSCSGLMGFNSDIYIYIYIQWFYGIEIAKLAQITWLEFIVIYICI